MCGRLPVYDVDSFDEKYCIYKGCFIRHSLIYMEIHHFLNCKIIKLMDK